MLTRKLISTVIVLSLLLLVRPVVSEANSPYGQKVANLALELVGTPYVFGGTSTSGFDASGLLVYVYGAYGAKLPRTVSDQATVGTSVTRANLLPGDIVLFSASGTRWTSIFVGNNEVVWASSGRKIVRKASLNDSAVSANYVSARRLPSTVFAPVETPKPRLASQIITTAEKYLGAPYVFGAVGPTAFDCSGFTRFVYAQHNISLPRTSLSQSQAGTLVAKKDMQKGDLLIFVDTYKAGISHVGIYIGDGKFIHTITSTGVSYSNLSQSYWSMRLHSVRRVIK